MASVVGAAGQAFFAKRSSDDKDGTNEVVEGPIKSRKAIASLQAAWTTNEPHPKLLNFINGEYVDPVKHEWINVVDPSCGEISCKVGRSDTTDVDAAVASAKAAYPGWSATPPAARAAFLVKIADGIRGRADELARLESCDAGKPLR
jgi:delta 1-pyrroline-5-carboxylate dehydrogenase